MDPFLHMGTILIMFFLLIILAVQIDLHYKLKEIVEQENEDEDDWHRADLLIEQEKDNG